MLNPPLVVYEDEGTGLQCLSPVDLTGTLQVEDYGEEDCRVHLALPLLLRGSTWEHHVRENLKQYR